MTYKPLKVTLTRIGDFLSAKLHKGITIYMFPSNQFKSIFLSIFLYYPAPQDKIKLMFLCHILRQGCRRYVNERKIHVYLEQIYAHSFNSQILQIHNTLLLNFELSLIADRFLPKKINSAKLGLKFLKDILFDPVKQNNHFFNSYFEKAKKVLEKQNLPEVSKITNAELTDFHKMLIYKAPIAIFAYGIFNPYKITRQVYHIFKTKRKNILNIPDLTNNQDRVFTDTPEESIEDNPFDMFLSFLKHKIK